MLYNCYQEKAKGYSVYLGENQSQKHRQQVGVATNRQAGDQTHIVTNSIMVAAPRGQNRVRCRPYRR